MIESTYHEPDPFVLNRDLPGLLICRGCGAVYPSTGPLANRHPQRCDWVIDGEYPLKDGE